MGDDSTAEQHHHGMAGAEPARKGVPAAGGQKNTADEATRDVEDALELTGLGRFHLMLLLGTWLGEASTNFSGTDITYALPAAECDLGLSPALKGWINAGVYCGMVTTAFVWGALSDWLGRKWLLTAVFLAMAACSAATALVTSAWAFLLCRVIMGALVIAPTSVNVTYAGEMFGPQHRSRVFMCLGSLQALSAAGHAALAMAIIPLPTLSLGVLGALRPWRAFLLVTAAVNATAGLFFAFLLPESPKYLAARGRGPEALAVLAGIYAVNSGLPAEAFPVKRLSSAQCALAATGRNPFATVARQLGKLMRRPLRTPMLFAVAFQPLIQLMHNAVRMWIPQMFADLERDAAAGLSRDVCAILESEAGGTASGGLGQCDAHTVDASVYLNSIVIMLARTGIQTTAGLLVRAAGLHAVLVVSLLVSAGAVFAWPWAASTAAVLGLSCALEGAGNVAYYATINMIVDLFPTAVRSSAVGLAGLLSRAASAASNVALPALFVSNCSAAFWAGAATLFLAAAFSFFRPRPTESANGAVEDEETGKSKQ